MRRLLVFVLALSMMALLAVNPTALAVQSEPFAAEMTDLSVAVSADSTYATPENSWFWTFCRNVLNLNFEVEQVSDPATYNQLSFASGSMPDLYVAMELTTIDIMNYGASEQQLVALDQYMTADKMPNITKVYEQYPNAKSTVTTPDGHIYSLGIVRETDLPDSRMYFNYRWLDELGLEVPATLDELNDAMYAMKEHFGEAATPLSGGYEAYNPSMLILNAFGYLTRDAQGLSIAMRDGKPVFPYGDREVFGEYLKQMNQYYTDGIISKDFFTMDATTYKALAAEDTMFVTSAAPYTVWPTTFDEWHAISPLTSEYSDIRQWPSGTNIISSGNGAISSNCENLDAALFFLDWLFDAENYVLTAYGPRSTDADWQFGLTAGWTMVGEYNSIEYSDMAEKGFETAYYYQKGLIYGWHEGSLGFDKKIETSQAMAGLEPVGWLYDPLDGDDNYRMTTTENLLPYAATGYPTVVFFTTEENEGITDLKTVLESYAEPEIAKFITGVRSLDELDAYFNELDNLGFQEYQNYYINYYEQYVAD